MSGKKVKECSPSAWCDTLDAMTDVEANSEARGLSVVLVTSFKTGMSRVVGVRCRARRGDPGVMLNVCPFCEARIDWEFAEKDGAS